MKSLNGNSAKLLLGLACVAMQRPAMGQPVAPNINRCRHLGAMVQIPSGSIGAAWVNPRNGQQLFHNTFHNQTSAIQAYSEEVTGEVMSSFDGSLALGTACARVGTNVLVSLRRVFSVSVPPRSSVTMDAYANMMSRSIEMLATCGACHEVIGVNNNWVTAARGINEYFRH